MSELIGFIGRQNITRVAKGYYFEKRFARNANKVFLLFRGVMLSRVFRVSVYFVDRFYAANIAIHELRNYTKEK